MSQLTFRFFEIRTGEVTKKLFNAFWHSMVHLKVAGVFPHVVHVVMHWFQRGYRDTSTLAFDEKIASTSVHIRVIIQTLDINFEVL